MGNCTNMVDVNRLFCADNVRTDDCLKIDEMVASIKKQGFKVNHPLVVSEKEDGRLLVLVGNRRATALFQIRDNDPQLFATIIPGGKIPAIVHKGLTVAEETLLRIDHSADEDRVPLSKASEFLAVRQLLDNVAFDTKLAEVRIAEHLGIVHGPNAKEPGKPNRSYVQPLVALSRMPAFVQNAYMDRWQGLGFENLKISSILGLSKIYRQELAEYPEGDGPLFTEAWAKANEAKSNKPKDGQPFTFTPKDAKDRLATMKGSLTKRLMLAVTGQGNFHVKNVDDDILAAEQAKTERDILIAYYGEEDYLAMVIDARKAIEAAKTPAEEEAIV